jgi:glucokinase
VTLETVAAGAKTVLTEQEGGIESITAETIADAVRRQDDLARSVWEDACRYLAIGCLNAQHSFNPAMIVLGGGMSAAGDLLLNAVREHLVEQRWSLMDDTPEVVLAELGNEAGMIGAAGLILESMENATE